MHCTSSCTCTKSADEAALYWSHATHIQSWEDHSEHPSAYTCPCKHRGQLPGLKLKVDLILWVHPAFPHRICLGSRSEGDRKCAAVSFSWRLHDLMMLDSSCKTSTCSLALPGSLLKGGRYYSIWVNREEKRQINNEVDWTLTALLLYSSLRGLKW